MDILAPGQRVLILSPHPDDEVAAAGTIIRLVDCGAQLRYVAFSHCDDSLPSGTTRDDIAQECMKCVTALGVPATAFEILNFSVRYFSRDRQDILEKLVALRREFEPDLVLLPASRDTHQDHAVISVEGFRAFKMSSSILGYEHLQNGGDFRQDLLVRLRDAELDRKIAAASSYRSQTHRPYANERYLRAQAAVRGMQAGTSWAEAFEVIKLIWK